MDRVGEQRNSTGWIFWANVSLLQVKRRVEVWSNLPESRKSPRSRHQLEWESHVVEYVSFIWEKTRPRKKGDSPAKLSLDIPLLGPRFVPPSYLHLQRRSGAYDVDPETQYLKPVNIIHPFYYPELACCPQCQSTGTDVTWEGWTGTGARELHGIFQEEVALGLQLRCNTCKSKKTTNGDLPNSATSTEDNLKRSNSTLQVEGKGSQSSSPSSYCCATTSSAYWKSWPHWKIPCE